MTTTAWYILPSDNALARWVNVLHWPYTLWHLSYVVIGAGLARELDWALLGWTLLAFFLAMGVAAHCYDLIKGDPLKLGLRPLVLAMVGGMALGLAVLIGFHQVLAGQVSPWLAVAIPLGALLVLGYNLEWPGLHGDWQFAAWWAVFPLLVSYFAQGADLHPSLVLAVLFAFATAYAQRVLSTRVRFLRRRVGKATVSLETWSPEKRGWYFGQTELKPWLLQADEKALGWLSLGMVLLAGGLLLSHV